MSTTASPQQNQRQRSNISRIIVLDNIAEQGLAKLQAADGIEYSVQTGLAGDELRDALANFDGAVCRSGVKITADALEGNNSLKAIVRAGVGTDNIDKEAATRLGIVVMNTPTGNTISTAELAMALMLGLSRNLAPAHASLMAGHWDRKKYSGKQLHGKTLGIVGLGRIGQEVGKRARAFGMDVLGYDPFLSNEQTLKLGFTPVAEVDDLLDQIDYLTVHTPLTPETKGLIGKAEIAKMKPGTRLINCARGGIYDEAALIDGLKSGHLGGVALDVYENEPCTDSPLFQMENVLCTPHLGASTEEAQIKVAEEAVDLLVNFLKSGEIRHAVNTIAVDPNRLAGIRGYLDVSYRLGIFLSQWHGGAIEKCELEFQGAISNEDTRLLTSAFCAGLLSQFADTASIINAEMLCKERGIQLVRQANEKSSVFTSVVSASVSGEGKTLRADGTVFGLTMPRLVRMNDYRIDTYMDGMLLVFSHRDVPGVIAHIGTILAAENVNIARMAVGRQSESPGGSAVGVLNVDTQVSLEAIEKTSEYEGMDAVKLIRMPAAGEYPDWLS